jgi:hypothetical protein
MVNLPRSVLNVKNPSFTISAFILSLLVFIPAAFIALSHVADLSHSRFLVSATLPIIFTAALFEAPLYKVTAALGFPVILPILTLASVGLGFRKRERYLELRIAALSLTVIGFLLYIII